MAHLHIRGRICQWRFAGTQLEPTGNLTGCAVDPVGAQRAGFAEFVRVAGVAVDADAANAFAGVAAVAELSSGAGGSGASP
ncbi:hypothetical protein AWC22_02860 [Mycobacterium riyadhense]|uniref:Uncharacterized protein n=1 Tax=Mycobacterium riyadhense TaxID=486698 RepID=A0A1X2BQC4_9MYCO|nr:hypothetical protein AWC22_02860 [Mycobacterium riyadhense]